MECVKYIMKSWNSIVRKWMVQLIWSEYLYRKIKENEQVANQHMEAYSSAQARRNLWVLAQRVAATHWRRWLRVKTITDSRKRSWRLVTRMLTLCWWECRLGQQVYSTMRQRLPPGPAITVFGVCLNQLKFTSLRKCWAHLLQLCS